MTTLDTPASAPLHTLVDALAQQALLRPNAIALRQKRLGLWHAKSWNEVAAEVAALSSALSARGFGAGDRLLLVSHPRAEALLVALAAQWLGGSAALIDPAQGDAHVMHIVAGSAALHVFAEDQQQVDRVLAALGSQPRLRTLAFADGRGLVGDQGNPQAGNGHGYDSHSHAPYLVAYAALASARPHSTLPLRAGAGQVAFHFLDLNGEGRMVQWPVTHSDSMRAGQELIVAERLDAQEVALASRGFTAGGHARYLIAPWLITGFSLNFPENLATRDHDRRELGPTLVAGTRDTYARLAALVKTRLPAEGTLMRGLIDRVLGDGQRRAPVLLAALVRRALREVIGFTRVRSPLLVGADLDADTRQFFAALGIQVRHWPEPQAALPLRDGVSDAPAGERLHGLGGLNGFAPHIVTQVTV